MAHAALTDALRMLRACWLDQLIVLGIGAIVVGAVQVAGFPTMMVQLLASTTAMLVLVALSAKVALRSKAGYDTIVSDLPGDALLVAPQMIVQGLLALSPIAAAWWIGMAAATLHPLLGLLSLPLALACSMVLLGPLLLVPAAVAAGDRSWIPRSVYSVARRSWRQLLVGTPVVIVLASMAALPLVLVGIVLTSQLGALSFLGTGLSAVSIVPWLGLGSVAAWRALDGARVAADLQDAGSVDEQPLTSFDALVATNEPLWVDGPSWDVAVDAGAVWGTWLRMSTASQVAVRIQWHDGAAPSLSLADQAGTWQRPGDPSSSGEAVRVALPPGDTYLQLQSQSSAAQAMSITLLLPATMAA